MTPVALADAARLAVAATPPVERLTNRDLAVNALSRRRWRMALELTSVMLVVYFSFVLGIAFNKPALGRQVTEGLSLGMVLGVLVIVVAFALTALYALWANRSYDPALERALKEDHQ